MRCRSSYCELSLFPRPQLGRVCLQRLLGSPFPPPLLRSRLAGFEADFSSLTQNDHSKTIDAMEQRVERGTAQLRQGKDKVVDELVANFVRRLACFESPPRTFADC